MKRTTTFGLIALLSFGLTISAFANSLDKDSTCAPRKEFHEKRLARMEESLSRLPPEEQKLARALHPLRDSLMRTIGEYRHKVKQGNAARSLTDLRATIASLEAQILKLQADNRELWLDLLADMPGPGGPGRHGTEDKGGPDWRRGKDRMHGIEGPNPGERRDCPRHRDGEVPPPPHPID